ncbi:Glycosyltransferase (GlcNAc) [Seminavis robusta]|uniref:Glycosyltransferase (GlcNAc) n=1 Tax=Seminavis robusta TaxID=568900 RepID=A0A9N8E4J1_9STRA|nr:Glycosyltransferase (GlcNAc) [Seminavis robusta]|eukprot:Sro536_g162140.1 Glycosyltransferase (GlcNAc) (496) ;mRNA; r:23173-25153
MGPRVHDGKNWVDITVDANSDGKPPAPSEDGDGKIFVVIPSFRDGKRCADTLESLFDNAADPDNIIVGIIEQNAPEDQFCLEVYCARKGIAKHYKRQTIRKDVTKLIAEPERLQCPRFNQIRQLAFHNRSAKGPLYARAMTRKILGNEEFCMQVDSHSSFRKDWDKLAKEDWKTTNNEFAVISHVPAKQGEQVEHEDGGAQQMEVPRQCLTKFQDNGVPNYLAPGDGKAADLTTPLLGNTWSAGFSFAKCHLEESAPYDPFAPYIMGGEQFPRYARMWTRGYDVYTPTRSLVFHSYQPNPDGHGMNEWYRQRRERIRSRSLLRIKTSLGLKDGDTSDTAKANMGIYGVGKRRTLDQFNDYVGINLAAGTGNSLNLQCANLKFVPYNADISPTDNLYDNPNDLDTQPEFPMRTNLQYYEQVDQAIAPPLELDFSEQEALAGLGKQGMTPTTEKYPFPPASTMLTLWFMGLALWCVFFMNSGGKKSRRMKGGGVKNV